MRATGGNMFANTASSKKQARSKLQDRVAVEASPYSIFRGRRVCFVAVKSMAMEIDKEKRSSHDVSNFLFSSISITNSFPLLCLSTFFFSLLIFLLFGRITLFLFWDCIVLIGPSIFDLLNQQKPFVWLSHITHHTPHTLQPRC